MQRGEIKQIGKDEFQWTIEHFSQLNSTVGSSIQSREFEAIGSTWRLDLYPGGYNAESAGFVSLYLTNHDGETVHATHRLEIIGHRDYVEGSTGFCECDNSWGDARVVEREKVLDPLARILNNDTLRIKVTLKKVATGDLIELSDSMGKLLNSGKHSDVTLVVQGTEIPAHRNILSSRSEFFAAMFEHKMSESLEGVVKIDDISVPVFKELLRFIYAAECDFDFKESDGKEGKEQKEKKLELPDKIMMVLEGADRVQLPGLVNLCSEHLADSLSTSNAAHILQIADQHHISSLKKKALDFCADNENRAAVMDSDEWLQLSPALLQEIIVRITPEAVSRKRDRYDGDELTQAEVKKLKVSELRGELQRRKLDIGGTKEELVGRLQNALTD